MNKDIDIVDLAVSNAKTQIDIDWSIIRNQVFRRDNNKCQMCGTKSNLTVHHIKPRSEGGSDSITNLITLCYKCHDIAEIEKIPTANLIRNWALEDNDIYEREKDGVQVSSDKENQSWLYNGQYRRLTELLEIVEKVNPELTKTMLQKRLGWRWWDIHSIVNTPPLLTETGVYV